MHLAMDEANKSAEDVAQGGKPVDPLEEGKTEDQKRKFMVPLRPHQRIWNFDFNEDECHDCKEGQKTGCCGEKPKHILRADADPTKCYIDGRIEKFLALVEQMSVILMSFSADRWSALNNATQKYFTALDIKENLNY